MSVDKTPEPKPQRECDSDDEYSIKIANIESNVDTVKE